MIYTEPQNKYTTEWRFEHKLFNSKDPATRIKTLLQKSEEEIKSLSQNKELNIDMTVRTGVCVALGHNPTRMSQWNELKN